MTQDPVAVIAYKLASAMAHDIEVMVTLRTRPVRHVKGKVSRRWIDKTVKIDPSDRAQSNLRVQVGGQEIAVDRISEVKRRAA